MGNRAYGKGYHAGEQKGFEAGKQKGIEAGQKKGVAQGIIGTLVVGAVALIAKALTGKER